MNITGLKQHLKTTTLPLHDWLESSSLFSDIKKNQLTQEQYSKLLIKMYQFIKVLESQIKEYKTDFIQAGLEDISKRLEKQEWLEDDLTSLDIPLSSDDSIKFNSLNNFSSIVGALYVLEGSTMGGMQIVKIMKTNGHENSPVRYYGSYNETTMPMWMAFASWLDNTSINQYDATLGAIEVFIALKKHLDNED